MSYNKYAEEYKKERKLLLQKIRRMKKRGYVFDKDTPKKPKRITAASVRKLRAERENIYKKAKLPDIKTGEFKKQKTRKQALQQEKKINEYYRNQKELLKITKPITFPDENSEPYSGPMSADYVAPDLEKEPDYDSGVYEEWSIRVIDNFRASIDFYNSDFTDYMNSWLDRLIMDPDIGPERTAQMLEGAAEDGVLVSYKMAYIPAERDEYINDLIGYIPDVGSFTRDHVYEMTEELDRYDYDEGMTAAEVAGL